MASVRRNQQRMQAVALAQSWLDRRKLIAYTTCALNITHEMMTVTRTLPRLSNLPDFKVGLRPLAT